MLEVTKIGENATFVRNNDVRNCEAIVFAEAVRTGRTMLQVIRYVLDEDDTDTNLLCACETLEEQIELAYKSMHIAQYLDEELYKYNK